MLLSLLSCGLNTTSTWSSVVEKEGKVKQWLIINALSSALDGKRWYYSNIQCEACSAEHDCQLSFISLLEGIRLLQILPVYAVRSSTILSTEYWWHHSKISLVCWEDAFSWDFDEQLSKKFPLFVPCRDVWILNSYFKCKIMKKKVIHFPRRTVIFLTFIFWGWSMNGHFQTDVHKHTLTEHLYNLHSFLGHFETGV